jgi:hypothetical protein
MNYFSQDGVWLVNRNTGYNTAGNYFEDGVSGSPGLIKSRIWLDGFKGRSFFKNGDNYIPQESY